MIVKVKGKEVKVNRNDLAHARRAVNNLLEAAKAGSVSARRGSLYITTILMMYKKSEAMIHSLGVDQIQKILEEVAEEEN